MRKPCRWIAGVMLLFAIQGYAGGPPILTLSHIPDYFVVGQPETVRFTTLSWCCGHVPLDNNTYSVHAVAVGHPEIRVRATPTGKDGAYTATLRLSAAGDWRITVAYALDPSGAVLLSSPPSFRTAILPGEKTPESLSQVALGERAFVEKGCSSCHILRDMAGEKYPFWRWPGGDDDEQWENVLRSLHYPELKIGRFFSEAHLRKVLTNPADASSEARMPNLDLSRDEIDALIAFLNR